MSNLEKIRLIAASVFLLSMALYMLSYYAPSEPRVWHDTANGNTCYIWRDDISCVKDSEVTK